MYELVDGLPVPLRLAGAVGLEVCNTRAGWGEPNPKEYLLGYEHLAVWAREAGLIPASACDALRERAAEHPGQAESVRRKVLALRESLYAVLVHPPAAEHWGLVARTASGASSLRRLVRDGDDLRPQWRLDEEASGLRLPLLAAALTAADWLTFAEPGSASACPGAGCGWVFANPTRRRRWCSMAVCGNRAKVRRHAARSRTSGAS